MANGAFIDHYETLQLSASADAETIGRVYRLLAKRFHPDNATTGDVEMFEAVTKAYEVLSKPEHRAKYDVTYDEKRGHEWRIFDQRSAGNSREEDRRIYHSVLSLLYVARRRDPDAGGLGVVHLERMLGVPKEHLEFPLWYLRRRGWTETLEGGQLAITVDGIDVLGSCRTGRRPDTWGQETESPRRRAVESPGHPGTETDFPMVPSEPAWERGPWDVSRQPHW